MHFSRIPNSAASNSQSQLPEPSTQSTSKRSSPSGKLHVDTLESMVLLSGSCHASGIAQVETPNDLHDGTSQTDIGNSTNSGHAPGVSACLPAAPNVIDTDNICGGSRHHVNHHATQYTTHQVVHHPANNTSNCYYQPPVSDDTPGSKGDDDQPPVSDDFDSILEWNDVMLDANAADHALATPDQRGPILTSRAFAIVSAAMYDAYNSIENIGDAYQVKAPYTNGANSDAAVAEAAYQALIKLFPSQKATFDAELAKSLARIADGASEDLGRAVGLHVAERILESRENDGAEDLEGDGYTPNGLPGFHDVDPLNPNQGFYGPGAVDIAPFAIQSADQFHTGPLDDGTPEGRIEFMKSDRYLQAYQEVKSLGGDGVNTPTARTAEQTQIGIFWGYDGRPEIGTPPRLYNQVVREIAVDQGNTEAENARLFALVNISLADAGISSWNTKYDDAFWRPILGIREGDADGNPHTIGDANFTPLGSQASNPRPGQNNFTPNFPAYTSGHATFGAAMFQTVARFYGTDDIEFSIVSDEFNGKTIGADGVVRPVVERSFSSLTEAKLESARSRIYLGIHWAFDAADGNKMGDGVANYVFDNILQPKKPGTGSTSTTKLA